MNAKKLVFLVTIALFAIVDSLIAQGTAFTYQGQLAAGGAPVSGSYDFTFALYNSPATNSGQVGPSLTIPGVGVTNGQFTVVLDFGANFPGANRWLAIATRPTGSGPFIPLAPLQQLTPTPYAIYSPNAGAAAVANSVSANNIVGALSLSQLPASVVTNTETGVTLGGIFSGNGASLNTLNASQLASGVVPYSVLPGFQASNNYSTLSGGQGNSLNGSYATIGGGVSNKITGNGLYATIGGGTSNSATAYASTVAGGQQNNAPSPSSTVGGGVLNLANGNGSVISGGGYDGTNNYGNTANGPASVIGGGVLNLNNGTFSVIGGGYLNLTSNAFSTVPGGMSNVASGNYSFAAGFNAHATNQGAFVWADSQPTPFSSTNTNSFNVRANGGVTFNTGGAGIAVDGAPVLTATSNSIQPYEINDGGSSGYQTFQQAVSAVGGDTSLVFSNIYPLAASSSPAFTLTVNGAALGTVVGFAGSEGLSQPYEYVVETQTSSALTNPDSELTLPAVLTFSRNGRTTTFAGIVTACTLAGNSGGNFLYTVKMESAMAYMALNTDYHMYQQLSAAAVAIADYESDSGNASVTTNLTGSYSPHSSLTQYGETDIAFFSRILEEEGIYYYFNHSSSSGNSLILGDSTAGYLTAPYSYVYYGNSATNIPVGAEYIRSFQKASHQSTLSSTVNSFNIATPTGNLSATANATEGIGTNFEFGNAVGTSTYDEQLAGVQRDFQTAQRSMLGGTANGPDLLAGYVFSVTDNSGAGLGGSYVVTAVHHAGFVRVTNGVSTFFYGDQFTAIPSSLTFRPPTRTKPIALSSYAVVVGPAGDEIYTDTYGRVKVLFSWDHHGTANQNSSAWIPVASPWAGSNRGMIFLPRIGDEVIVDFLEGDPDQPIITGSVYTGAALPPFTLPEEDTQSGILTQSSSGTGFNELRFEDLAGSEQIYMHAQKDMDVDIVQDLVQNIGNDKTETITANRSETVDGTDTLHIAGTQTVTITGSQTESVNSSASMQVAGTYSVTAGALSVSGPGTYYGPTTISNTLSVAVDTTGTFNSPAASIQNLDTTTNSGPALRVVAQGSPAYGALSVSCQGSTTCPVASFGNANVWVSFLDNSGNWYARGSFYGTTIISLSDRNAKENFADISTSNVLEKVAALPLSRWNYKTDKSTEHIGPMAQDFYAAFHLGPDDKHIATVDEEGIALAAIQGLNQKLKAQLEERDAKINDLEKRLNDLQQTVQALAAKKQIGPE